MREIGEPREGGPEIEFLRPLEGIGTPGKLILLAQLGLLDAAREEERLLCTSGVAISKYGEQNTDGELLWI